MQIDFVHLWRILEKKKAFCHITSQILQSSFLIMTIKKKVTFVQIYSARKIPGEGGINCKMHNYVFYSPVAKVFVPKEMVIS